MIDFEPKIRPGDRYAVVVPAEGRLLIIIETYPSLEQLETGYRHWRRYSADGKLTSPFPIEIVDSRPRVLRDLIE